MASKSAATVWKSIDGYQLSTGERYTINEQVIFHNEGFAEYFVDFTLDLKQYETIFGAQLGLVSYLSVYVHTNEDEFVGFARSAIRGQRIWVCGLSIVPRFRGKGVGPVLLREYLNLLRERSDVRLLQLEVIKENARALKLYKRFGFNVTTELREYEIEDVTTLAGMDSLSVSTSDRLDLALPWLQQRIDYSWQRELSSLLNSSRDLKQFVVKEDGGRFVVALAIETAMTPFRVTGFAYRKSELTSGELAAAIRLAIGNASKGVSIMFEPDTSDVVHLLEGIDGCVRETGSEEYQMVLPLARNERK